MKKTLDHPALFTGFSSMYGLIGDIALSSFPLCLTINSGLGFACDVMRKTLNKSHTLSKDTLLEGIVEEEYLSEVIQEVKEFYGLEGRFKTFSAFSSQGGTYSSKGGYFIDVRFLFDDGDAHLLYKYVNRPTAIAHHFIEDAHVKGVCSIPRIFNPRREFLMDSRKMPRGVFYEWMIGESLEKNIGNTLNITEQIQPPFVEIIMRQMDRIYCRDFLLRESNTNIPAHMVEFANSPILKESRINDPSSRFYHDILSIHTFSRWIMRERDYKFHQDLLQKIEDPGFMKTLDKLFYKNFLNPSKLIHGDLHQGNVLDSGYILDFDNIQYGIPYHDFSHFATISDFDRADEYISFENNALENCKKYIPWFKMEHKKIIDLEIALSLLHRYAKGDVRDEFRSHLDISCRYLLEKCRRASPLELSDDLENYLFQTFPSIVSIPLNPRASVAYAHMVNQKFSTKQGSAFENFKIHSKNVEAIVAEEGDIDRLSYFGLQFSTSLFALATPALVYAHQLYQSLSPGYQSKADDLLSFAVPIIIASAAIISLPLIYKKISPWAYRYIKKIEADQICGRDISKEYFKKSVGKFT